MNLNLQKINGVFFFAKRLLLCQAEEPLAERNYSHRTLLLLSLYQEWEPGVFPGGVKAVSALG